MLDVVSSLFEREVLEHDEILSLAVVCKATHAARAIAVLNATMTTFESPDGVVSISRTTCGVLHGLQTTTSRQNHARSVFYFGKRVAQQNISYRSRSIRCVEWHSGNAARYTMREYVPTPGDRLRNEAAWLQPLFLEDNVIIMWTSGSVVEKSRISYPSGFVRYGTRSAMDVDGLGRAETVPLTSEADIATLDADLLRNQTLELIGGQ